MAKNLIYTIGHSTHSINFFCELLKHYNINCLIDVRSVAASSFNPQFNKVELSGTLKNNGIIYMHFANEFGARHTEQDLLDGEGKVDFNLVRKSVKFKNGVKRLNEGYKKGYTIVLMCSESNPLECHRFSMISLALETDGFEVKHILKDKSIKSNLELEFQLLEKYLSKSLTPDMFPLTISEQLTEAYRLRNKEIAFSPYTKK